MKRNRLFTRNIISGSLLLAAVNCGCNYNNDLMQYQEMQLTADHEGHTIHNTQVFSPDNEWIAFDSRNNENAIGSTGAVGMVNVKTKEIKYLYRTTDQTVYGPGVGAVTFSPNENKVLFIHGIRNASKEKPYGFTRRTGVAIDIRHPFKPIFMDARDVIPPFTPGALRGGTHAHTWSGDGKWISFTYNDYIIEQLSQKDSTVKDLRTIGVMFPGKVEVNPDASGENHSGEMFSVLVVPVTENPLPGSDEIDRAFDEGWIGNNGYVNQNGVLQNRAIAFQGNVRNEENRTITEVFVADIPDDLSQAGSAPLEGTMQSRPAVPKGISIKRVTFTENGLSGPRFWLRSTPDGSMIGFLAPDERGIIQVFGVSPNGGKIRQITNNQFSVQGPFNFSPDGERLAYCADNRIFITDLKTGKTSPITPPANEKNKPIGAPVFSNDGKMIAYNRYLPGETGNFVQIFAINLQSIKALRQ
ncbi:MAG: DUF3748 domain-containing protein [Chitinophagaceae bacterium]|nr:DUF3748 domain-containing protein [Chitinophagaceae bacterium]MCW5927204.1 DUF3748 domain-containing protein [Chitinophagaceae bacterium]